MIIVPDREEAEETADPSEAKLKRLVSEYYEFSECRFYHILFLYQYEWTSHVMRPVFKDMKDLQNLSVMKSSNNKDLKISQKSLI